MARNPAEDLESKWHALPEILRRWRRQLPGLAETHGWDFRQRPIDYAIQFSVQHQGTEAVFNLYANKKGIMKLLPVGKTDHDLARRAGSIFAKALGLPSPVPVAAPKPVREALNGPLDIFLVELLARVNRDGWWAEGTEPIPYGRKLVLAGHDTKVGLRIYHSAKKGISVLATRSREGLPPAILEAIGEIQSNLRDGQDDPMSKLLLGVQDYIGTDEAGNGSYFGPIVVAGFRGSPEDAKTLVRMGVVDCKLLSPKQTKEIAHAVYTRFKDRIVWKEISPADINHWLNRKSKAVRKYAAVTGWGHANVARRLAKKNPETLRALLTDQFGPERYLVDAWPEIPRDLRVILVPRAERDPLVAAASIIARARFMRVLQDMSHEAGVDLPAGSGTIVESIARQVVARHGADALDRWAKTSFSITERVLHGGIR